MTTPATNAEAMKVTPASAATQPAARTATGSSARREYASVYDAQLPRDTTALVAAIQQLVSTTGASVGVTLVELNGTEPITWALDGSTVFTAASTYKLAALMMEAQGIAAGTTDPGGLVCYQPDDYEAGWFDDYSPGECFTRYDLAWRAGIYSDNTAGHMLVRDVGGAAALNAWAASIGASNTSFFVGNTTTSDDLAALWVAESAGLLGGTAAQAWLYPLLTNTSYEAGIPAGVGAGTEVVHKIGALDQVDDDAALVVVDPDEEYILTVMTDGPGGDAGWQLIASISAAVWQFESSRPS